MAGQERPKNSPGLDPRGCRSDVTKRQDLSETSPGRYPLQNPRTARPRTTPKQRANAPSDPRKPALGAPWHQGIRPPKRPGGQTRKAGTKGPFSAQNHCPQAHLCMRNHTQFQGHRVIRKLDMFP